MYCVSLTPPLLDLNDELLRLLHETLALADAEDAALLGRSNPRQGMIEMTKLRVSCIKLLTASMPMTDFFQKHPQTRQRYGIVISLASFRRLTLNSQSDWSVLQIAFYYQRAAQWPSSQKTLAIRQLRLLDAENLIRKAMRL